MGPIVGGSTGYTQGDYANQEKHQHLGEGIKTAQYPLLQQIRWWNPGLWSGISISKMM